MNSRLKMKIVFFFVSFFILAPKIWGFRAFKKRNEKPR